MLKEKMKAPEFDLEDYKGERISLKNYLGKRVVLYFYPKDNTPGCTRQACAFAQLYQEFVDLDVVVIGVSKDSIASHKKFVEKYNLPFILLSDPSKEIILAYDVYNEKKLYGKLMMGVTRATYIIDKEGLIEKVFPKANPDSNASEIIEYLRSVS